MIGTFLVICVGMILGMVMVHVWDTASQAIAALPPEGSPPAARTTPDQAPKPTGAVPTVSVAAPPGTGPVTTEIQVLQPNYTVSPGDTLGNIARKHGSSIEALASINNLENRNSLSIGQKLIIP
jgi:LysM repeat protein